MRGALPILWDVFEEHLDEAGFLFTRWERALGAPFLTPSQVAAGVEERLLAHLHALALGGPAVSKRLLEPALAGEEPEQVFSAAYAFLSEGEIEKVLQALHCAQGEVRAALQRALELHPRPELERHLLPLATKGWPPVQAVALEVLAFRSADPGEALRAGAASRDPAVTQAALQAARFSPTPWARRFVLSALGSSLPGTRDAAVETGLVLGLRDAWEACRGALAQPSSAPRAGLLAALGGDAEDQDVLLAGLRALKPSHAALWAAGFSGRVAAADACLEAMRQEGRTARLAGEAFSAITGLRIEGQFAEAEPPKPDEPIPFEEEDLAANLVPGPEDDLPMPATAAVAKWWGNQRAGFEPGLRYLNGKLFGLEPLREAVERGPMRRRRVLALEIEIRSRGALRIGPRRWVHNQRASLEGLGPGLLSRPFKALAKET